MKYRLRIIYYISFSWILIVSTCLWAQSSDKSEDDGVTTKEIEIVLGVPYIDKLDFAVNNKVYVDGQSVTYALVPVKREIILTGIKPGPSSIILRDIAGDVRMKYSIKVTQNSLSKLLNELKLYLGDIEGLEFGIKGESAYIGGEIVVPSDIGRVAVILRDSKYNKIINLIELSPHTQRVVAKKMQDEIQNSGLRNITVRVVNKRFWLEGTVSSQNEQNSAIKIANAYLPDNLVSLAQGNTKRHSQSELPMLQIFISINSQPESKPVPKLLKITAQFVELSKNYNKIFGFSWTPLRAGDGGSIDIGKTTTGGITTRSQGTLRATISNLFPKLASAKGAGYARIVQSGVLIIQDREKGSLSKTSEQPYSLGTNEFTQAKSTVTGFEVNITPTILKDENISLDLGISVSTSVGNPPAKLDNTVKTKVVIKSKESAVIGGVVVNKSSTTFDRDEPNPEEYEGGSPLFSFLRSKAYLINRSQFVVFVTPAIIDSASVGTKEIKRKFKRRR